MQGKTFSPTSRKQQKAKSAAKRESARADRNLYRMKNDSTQPIQEESKPLANSRHEAFAQAVADGKFANEAYREVYKCKDSTARRNASDLLTNPLVRARVGWLQAQNAKVKALTRERKREILAIIAESSKEDSRARIAAIQEDNRMTGDSADNFNVKGEGFVFNLGGVLKNGDKH